MNLKSDFHITGQLMETHPEYSEVINTLVVIPIDLVNDTNQMENKEKEHFRMGTSTHPFVYEYFIICRNAHHSAIL